MASCIAIGSWLEWTGVSKQKNRANRIRAGSLVNSVVKSTLNSTTWHRLLKLVNASYGNPGIAQIEVGQGFHLFEVGQCHIRERGTAAVQYT